MRTSRNLRFDFFWNQTLFKFIRFADFLLLCILPRTKNANAPHVDKCRSERMQEMHKKCTRNAQEMCQKSEKETKLTKRLVRWMSSCLVEAASVAVKLQAASFPRLGPNGKARNAKHKVEASQIHLTSFERFSQNSQASKNGPLVTAQIEDDRECT